MIVLITLAVCLCMELQIGMWRSFSGGSTCTEYLLFFKGATWYDDNMYMGTSYPLMIIMNMKPFLPTLSFLAVLIPVSWCYSLQVYFPSKKCYMLILPLHFTFECLKLQYWSIGYNSILHRFHNILLTFHFLRELR